VKIYRSGIHKGEEPYISGNQSAGMIVFSGCHLACSFCYTPETSMRSIGHKVDQNKLLEIISQLESSGAKNLNFITVTHIWSSLKKALTGRSFNGPLVFKMSGYQTTQMIQDVRDLNGISVIDFKMVSPQICKRYGLPKDYGNKIKVLAKYLSRYENQYELGKTTNLKAGHVIRHLIMPHEIQETFEVIKILKEENYSGILNLTSYFIDPKKGLKTPSSVVLKKVLTESMQGHFQVSLNGQFITQEEIQNVG
jgi:putative pyruvate formate lyase activating enzyme